MSVYRRPESCYWWYAVSRGRGKPYLRGSTGKTVKAEAEAVEHVLRLAYQKNSTPARLHAMIDTLLGQQKSGLPLCAVWKVYSDWVTSTGRALAEGSLRQRRRICERFAEWAAGNWPSVSFAGEVERACAAGFATWLAGEGARGKTRRNLLGDLSTVWEGLRRVRDDVKVNPWPLVLPHDDGKRGAAFSFEQERVILDAADKAGHGWGLACRIARYTGLRYGDVARLRWADVDLDAGVIRTEPSKTARHGVGVVVPLCAPLALALAGARRAAPAEEFVLPEHAKAYPEPLTGGGGVFAGVLRKAEIKGAFTFHSWRHTFRTRLAEAGVSDELAKRLGGWTVDKTAMRYDHDGRIAELRAAVEQGAQASG